jgi:CTP:phosphocholine cytidylyltransferase-like protein
LWNIIKLLSKFNEKIIPKIIGKKVKILEACFIKLKFPFLYWKIIPKALITILTISILSNAENIFWTSSKWTYPNNDDGRVGSLNVLFSLLDK